MTFPDKYFKDSSSGVQDKNKFLSLIYKTVCLTPVYFSNFIHLSFLHSLTHVHIYLNSILTELLIWRYSLFCWRISNYFICLANSWPNSRRCCSNITSYGKLSLTLLCEQLRIPIPNFFSITLPQYLTYYVFRCLKYVPFQLDWEPLEGRGCAVFIIIFPVANKMAGTEW